MPTLIYESRSLLAYGGIEYRVVATSNDIFCYEVKGPKDALGIESWVVASPDQENNIKRDLLNEYLAGLTTKAMNRPAKR